jgi:hypothetical protein
MAAVGLPRLELGLGLGFGFELGFRR